MWTCVDANGNLLGYVTAQYMGKDKVFSGFTKTITTKGNSSASVTHDRPEDDAEKVQSTVDAIKQQVGDTTSNVSEKMFLIFSRHVSKCVRAKGVTNDG